MDLLTREQIFALPSCRPDSSGVYFLIDGDSILYIGASGNVRRRLYMHTSAKLIPFTRYTVLELPFDDIWDAEYQHIKAFRPSHNRQYNPDIQHGGVKEEKSQTVGVRLPLSLIAQLKRQAKSVDRSVPYIIRNIIKDAIGG